MIDSDSNSGDVAESITEDTMVAFVINDESEPIPRKTELPHIWGYIRMSDQKQENSPKVQAEQIRKFAETLDGTFVGFRLDEAVSASKVMFEDRDEARKLMNDLRPGDHLIVCKLDRLGRSVIDLHKVLDKLNRMQINIYILNFGNGRLDLTTVMGKAIIGLFAVLAEMESGLISERTKEAMAYRKKMGLVSHSRPKYGYTLKRKPAKIGQRKGDAYYTRHEEECRAIKEIYERHSHGESMPRIFYDFRKRKLIRADGLPWAKEPTCLTNQLPSINRFYKVYEFYKQEFALTNKEL